MTATFSQTDAGTTASAPPRTGATWTPGSEDDRRLRVARWLLEVEEAGFAFVKVPEPIPHPSGDPKLADCHCPRTSETRARNSICASPGKHPTGEAWQRSGSRDLRVIAGILRQPGFQLGVLVQPGGRGLVLDEDLRTGIDGDALIAEWAERERAEPTATFVVRSGGGGRHIYGLRPEGYVLPASWPGGEVRWAGDGSKGGGMVVAPLGLHASGNRYDPLTGVPPVEFPASLLDHLVGRHATSGDEARGEGTDRERDTEGFRVPLPGEAWYAAVNSWCGRLRHLDRTDGEAWARVLELAPGLSDWETRRDFGDGCADRVTHLRHRFESCWADAKHDFEPAGEPIHINLGGTRGSSADPTGPWPAPLDADAFHGLAGRFARAVIPYSEGDPPAILCQALAMFGCLVGSEVYAIAGDAPHPARLNLLTVGVTGKGRKDTAGRPAKRLAAYADPAFTSRFVEGLSSGEGVLWAVRDPIVKTVMTGKGPDRHSEEQEVDPGVADKRLFVRESEFASLLRAASATATSSRPLCGGPGSQVTCRRSPATTRSWPPVRTW